jgi:hypothetical protein
MVYVGKPKKLQFERINLTPDDMCFPSMGILKDRRRRPEGRGEWEPIKILLENLAYIPILDLTFLSSNSVKTAQL